MLVAGVDAPDGRDLLLPEEPDTLAASDLRSAENSSDVRGEVAVGDFGLFRFLDRLLDGEPDAGRGGPAPWRFGRAAEHFQQSTRPAKLSGNPQAEHGQQETDEGACGPVASLASGVPRPTPCLDAPLPPCWLRELPRCACPSGGTGAGQRQLGVVHFLRCGPFHTRQTGQPQPRAVIITGCTGGANARCRSNQHNLRGRMAARAPELEIDLVARVAHAIVAVDRA